MRTRIPDEKVYETVITGARCMGPAKHTASPSGVNVGWPLRAEAARKPRRPRTRQGTPTCIEPTWSKFGRRGKSREEEEQGGEEMTTTDVLLNEQLSGGPHNEPSNNSINDPGCVVVVTLRSCRHPSVLIYRTVCPAIGAST